MNLFLYSFYMSTTPYDTNPKFQTVEQAWTRKYPREDINFRVENKEGGPPGQQRNVYRNLPPLLLPSPFLPLPCSSPLLSFPSFSFSFPTMYWVEPWVRRTHSWQEASILIPKLWEKSFLSEQRNWKKGSLWSEECEENSYDFFPFLFPLCDNGRPICGKQQPCRKIKSQLCSQHQEKGLPESRKGWGKSQRERSWKMGSSNPGYKVFDSPLRCTFLELSWNSISRALRIKLECRFTVQVPDGWQLGTMLDRSEQYYRGSEKYWNCSHRRKDGDSCSKPHQVDSLLKQKESTFMRGF